MAEVMLCLLLRLVTRHTGFHFGSSLFLFLPLLSLGDVSCHEQPMERPIQRRTEFSNNNSIDEFGNGPPASTNC